MNNIIRRVWNQNRMVNIEALSGMAFQAEDGGHTFEISGINDANEAVSLSGTVAGVFMRPDGTDVALTGTASDGVVSVILSDACYAVAGRFGLTIFVTADSKTTCVYACVGTVAQTSYGTVAGDTPQDVVDLVNAINNAITALNAAIGEIPADYSALMSSIAPTYSSTALYTKGSYAWYDGVLRKSIVDITTAESFTPAHWETVALADDVETILNNTLITSETVTDHSALTWVQGYIKSNDGTIGSSSQDLASNTFLGDGKTWHVSVASGFIIYKVARYSGRARGTFEEIVLPSGTYTDFDIQFENGKYYSIQVEKSNAGNISPSDITDGTIAITYTERLYMPILSEYVHSYNWCDPSEISAHNGKYMNTSGTVGTDTNFAYTGFIPVSAGEKVYVLQDGVISSEGRYRYVTAFNENKQVVSDAGDSVTRRVYTVPDGIAFVIVTIYLADYASGKYAINVGRQMPYDEYDNELLPKGVGNNRTNILLLNAMPLSTMPAYLRNVLSYRPLTAPTKGYFCFVTDDGHADMVTYTIPMVIDKNIPCTFAVFKESACFATPEQTAVVVDAVQNHGCAISQHGGRNWTEFSEYGLNKFFDEEKAFFDGLGLSVKSAVAPSHYMSDVVKAVAGGRFGVVRSGGRGYDPEGHYGGTVRNYYDYFTSGAGSNLFALSSYNVTTHTLAENELAVDYAYANNKIMIVYIHENSLNAEKKAVLESVIDYAKTKGLEFITLDKIPYLNEGTITM